MRFAWFVLFFVILFIWHAFKFANYNTEVWVFIYYLWDKLKDFFAFLLITQLVITSYKDERLIACFKIWTFFLAIRAAWECVVFVIGGDINYPAAMEQFFYVCWVLIFYSILYPELGKIIEKVHQHVKDVLGIARKFIWSIKDFFVYLYFNFIKPKNK